MKFVVGGKSIEMKYGEIVTVGNHLYMLCSTCRSLVRINKPLIGSLHICSLPEDRP